MNKLLRSALSIIEKIPLIGGALVAISATLAAGLFGVGLVYTSVLLELNPGVITLFFGAPVFLFLLPFFAVGVTTFVEEMWRVFGLYRLLGLKGRPIRSAWVRIINN
ncbi:hypothetical protein [Candidatus Halocynthiibacter alkanivorans]|uniref:hypothetical protein n=1 Tax=Candidatus Halocynthiibacter alkanivorans TaxID=2267619 RepID=UPI000DF4143B|nr:hypothetical protein [Candidatus Halocynthiibacter alkanivorans]